MYDLMALGDVVFDTIISPEDISLMCPHGRIKSKTCFEKVLCLPFGDKIPITKMDYSLGGSAANVAVGLARQNFKVGFISALGSDEKSNEILIKLEDENINTRYLKKIKNMVANFSIIIAYKGERTILMYRGLTDYAKIVLPKFIKSDWLFISSLGKGYEKLYRQIIPLVSEKNLKIAINPGNLQIKEEKYLKEILRVTKIIFVNRAEAVELCRARPTSSIKNLLSEIKILGPEIVIITEGKEGAYSFDGENMYKIGTFMAKLVESTGAGDSFSSGFMGAILAGKDLTNALQYGVINSASVIEHYGAQKGLLKKAELEKRVYRAPKPHFV